MKKTLLLLILVATAYFIHAAETNDLIHAVEGKAPSQAKSPSKSNAYTKAFGSKSGEIGYITLPSGNKMEMIWCEPGAFMMGAKGRDSQANGNERPRHLVRLTKGFWMSKYLVTQSQWKEIMGYNPSENDEGDMTKLPVTNISYDDCMVFVDKFQEKTGTIVRLPTEAEWEYAYRAGTTTTYYWGNTYDASAEKKANSWGFEGLTHLLQWCVDWYDGNFYAHSPEVDPVCRTSEFKGKCPVARGNSQVGNDGSRGSHRSFMPPFTRADYGGLRIVCMSLETNNTSAYAASEGWDSHLRKQIFYIREINEGSVAQRLGVAVNDVICEFGKYGVLSQRSDEENRETMSATIKSYLNKEKRLFLVNGKGEFRVIDFPCGPMGIRITEGRFPLRVFEKLEKEFSDYKSQIKPLIPAVGTGVSAEPPLQSVCSLKSGNEKTMTLPSGMKVQMIYCAPGEFMMGATNDERDEYRNKPCGEDEKPQHRVKISKGFWMCKYPISQEIFKSIVGRNPSGVKDDNRPVTHVSWKDCDNFVATLRQKGFRCRLPTEAEWEYACRSGTKTAYWWGNNVGEMDSKGIPTMVRTPNPWGFVDMKNIEGRYEWCSDWYKGDFYKMSPIDDPICTSPTDSDHQDKIARGGPDSRCASRMCDTYDSKRVCFRDVGFRILCEESESQFVPHITRPTERAPKKLKVTYDPNLLPNEPGVRPLLPSNSKEILREKRSGNGRSVDSDDGSDDMDEKEAYASTGIRDVARQMRFQATQCRVQAQQAQMNAQQMSMFANSYADAAMAMSANNMGQVAAQFALLYDRMADEWESLDDEEQDYFRDMKNTTSRKERAAMFTEAKDKLHRLIASSDHEGAWKLYATTRRAIMSFRRSFNSAREAEEWIRIQDEYYMRRAMQQQENLQQNAMNMAMQSFAGANESFKKSLEASKLPSRRCGACNKQYYGYGGCPQCSGPRYGLRSKLIDDDDHPGEKVRIYW